MTITATELKMNISKYLKLSEKEDVMITKNGRVVAKLSNPYEDRLKAARSLFGILPSDIDEEKLKDERLSKL